MAIGVMTNASSSEAARAQILDHYPSLTVIRTKKIDVVALQEHSAGGIGADWWVVVVEGSPLPDQDDPEGETETRFFADMRGILRRAQTE